MNRGAEGSACCTSAAKLAQGRAECPVLTAPTISSPRCSLAGVVLILFCQLRLLKCGSSTFLLCKQAPKAVGFRCTTEAARCCCGRILAQLLKAVVRVVGKACVLPYALQPSLLPRPSLSALSYPVYLLLGRRQML